MKKFILRLRNRFLRFIKPKSVVRPAFDIQQKIQQKTKKAPKNKPNAIIVPAVPMAKVTIQTIQIPMVDKATLHQALKSIESQLPQAERRREPSIIRRPLSEKDIADLSSVLKSFHGNDVRDLF